MNCYEKIVDSTQGLVGYIQTDNKDISWRNYQSYDKIMNKSKMLPLEGISEKVSESKVDIQLNRSGMM